MPQIHHTAQIGEHVTLAENVTIGPFCILDGHISIGAQTELKANVHLWGNVTIGKKNTLHSNAVIGDTPQDLSFKPETKSGVTIGDGNIIRENVTIHRGSAEGGLTHLGNECLLMAGAHLGHDANVGNNTILGNNTLLGGFVQVGNNVFLGGGTGVHQFVKVGHFSMTQGNSGLSQDLPPYCVSHGINIMAGLNVIGLKRAGFSIEQRKEIKQLFRLLFQSGKNLSEAIKEAREHTYTPEALVLLNAVASPSRKGAMTR